MIMSLKIPRRIGEESFPIYSWFKPIEKIFGRSIFMMKENINYEYLYRKMIDDISIVKDDFLYGITFIGPPGAWNWLKFSSTAW